MQTRSGSRRVKLSLCRLKEELIEVRKDLKLLSMEAKIRTVGIFSIGSEIRSSMISEVAMEVMEALIIKEVTTKEMATTIMAEEMVELSI